MENIEELNTILDATDIQDEFFAYIIETVMNTLKNLDMDELYDLFSDDPEVIRAALLGATDEDFFEDFKTRI